MIVEITIKDDLGKVLAEYQGDALKPGDYKCHPDKPLIHEDDAATYRMWNLIYQPTVTRVLKRR